MQIDDAAVRSFWRTFADGRGLPADAEPNDVFMFGDSPEMADELLDLVLNGPKRATASAAVDYERSDEPVPSIGDLSVICDGAGRPRAIIETTDVRIGPLSSVDDAFAWDEGEGDRTRADWLRAHTQFFTRSYAQLGLVFHDDIPVVFERFAVVQPAAADD